MRNLLVTGGAGFIGSNFVHYMLEHHPDYRVVVYDKLTYAGRIENLDRDQGNPRFAFEEGDICDAARVREAIQAHDIDTIVNFAAESHVDRSILDPDAFVKTDVYGAYVLCEAARDLKLERFHHISSVTGDTPLLIRDETTGEIALRSIETLDGLDLRKYAVLSLDANNQVRFARMRHFIKHPVDEVYEISFNGGGKIRATSEHSVFIFDDGNIIAKPSSELRVGDMLVTFLGDVAPEERRPHQFDFQKLLEDYTTEWLPGSIESRRAVLEIAGAPVRAGQLFAAAPSKVTGYRIANELISEGLIERTGSIYHITERGIVDTAQNLVATRWNLIKRQLHLPYDQLAVTPLLMQVFGLYLAEGHAAHTEAEQKRHGANVIFTISLEETEELGLLQRCAEELFGIHASVRQRESTYQVTYSSLWVHRLFSQFGATAETKELPAWIWSQPRELIAAFFKGYEGDARVHQNGQRQYTSVSCALIEQLVWLGRLNDINTRISSRTGQQVAGLIPPGCTVTRKRTFYDLAISSEHARSGEAGPWRTPMARCLPTEGIRSALKTGALFQRTRRKKLVGKQRLQQEIAARNDIPEGLRQLAHSAVGVAEVRSVERLPGDFMVYDVSVPGTERFFGGNVPCLLHNTDEVYGPIPQGTFAETDPFRPTSPYASSKAGGELLVLSYHITYGLPITITRGVNTYGPYQHPEKAIPLFITNAIDDTPLPLYGDGRQARDRLYVTDHARAVDFVLQHGKLGEAYNIAANSERTNIDVARKVVQALGKPESLIQPVKDRAAHDVRYALNTAKLEQLGWKPLVGFDEGFAQTVEWYVARQDWWRAIKSGEYQEYYRKQYVERG